MADPTATPAGLGRSTARRRESSSTEQPSPGSTNAGHAFELYLNLYADQRTGPVAPQAPIPEDRDERANNLKAGLYFLDADMVAVADLTGIGPDSTDADHTRAVVILIAHTRQFSGHHPGDQWIDGTRRLNADLRASELAIITASYIRHIGYSATAHTEYRDDTSDVDLERVALQAGLIEVTDRGLVAPYLTGGYSLAAVTTNLDLTPDAPLAPRGLTARLVSTNSPAWYLGRGGTRAGLNRLNGDHRPLHLGRYPMERIRRVDEPTTLILEDEIQRVPVRGGGFPRAANGDLGPRFEQEVKVFAFKTPQAQTYVEQIRSMVPHQDGPINDQADPQTSADPEANAEAVKALAYHLGGDMVGLCRAPEWAWYSHRGDGTEVTPDHANAIVILLDQGYETMEGASGDDWISGAQSMRAYMRGAQIAGIIASHIRSLGWGARSHTNALSEVQQLPLVLMSGLGELSRIGELVLNPFVGPRFKSVVVTTDMPLTPDRPIDFGLQDFCQKCTKCARECPCGAIPFGDKIMFNGYEIWKPDVEKCTKYRVGNQKGSACGRCMKTCPYNIEGVLAERALLWAAIKVPFTRRFIANLDDRVGNGSINPLKKWWWDLEWRDGRADVPSKGTNARDLDLNGGRIADKQKIALYTPDLLPPGDAIGVPVKLVRKEALARTDEAETPDQARRRAGS